MDINAIKKIFTEIKSKIKGLNGLLLITEDGFPIVSTLDSGDEEVKSTAVGAILCEAGQRGIRELRLGNLEAVVTIGSEGYFVLTRVEDSAILMAVASPDATLGMVLLKIKKAMPEIIRAFGNS